MSFASTQLGSSHFRHYLPDRWITMFSRLRKNGSSLFSSGEDAVEGCLFCLKYSASENRIMLENDAFFARYDNFPASAGHIEIVPKRHVESFFELSAGEVAKAYTLMSQARNELNEHHHPEGYTIGVNEGDASGRSVKHLHIHLIPRHYGDVDDPRGGIRQVVPNWDPDLWQSGRDLQRTHA
jgi:diadenosine tetraphosphate (Ap4A) HIT family hydrolase